MNKIRLLTTTLLLATSLSMVASVTPVQAGSTTHFDGLLWTSIVAGIGPVIHHSQITIPADAVSTDPSSPSIGAGLQNVCKLKTGDFDIQVSFKLSVWPQANGVRVNLFVLASPSDPGLFVERFSASTTDIFPTGEYYYYNGPTVPTSDLSGQLRLVRVGTSVTGYYKSGLTWVQIGGPATHDGDLTFVISAGSINSVFAHQQVKVTFSDFIINSGTLVCP